jgi:hypothetical protein
VLSGTTAASPPAPSDGGRAILAQAALQHAFFDARQGLYRDAAGGKTIADASPCAWHFIAVAGWARNDGSGIWWDTTHGCKTIEPLAAEVLIGVELYRATHRKWYLNESLKLLAWADAHSWNRTRALYQRNECDGTVMNYVEGMMIGAHVTLCRALRRMVYCWKAEQLAAASVRAFPQTFFWANETDAIYYRWLLTLYAVDRKSALVPARRHVGAQGARQRA